MITFNALLPLNAWGPFVTIDHFLSTSECSKLKSIMTKEKLQKARIGTNGIENHSIRSTTLCALDYTPHQQWIFQRLKEAITQVNADVYRADLSGFDEAINLMQYEPGDFYGWHMDFGDKQFSLRKLSFTLQLSDPDEYEGGTLEFFRNGVAPKSQGSLTLFAPYLYHQVTPITRGVRHALVGWVSGPAFR